ncbi:MAG: GH32 C-terminal domain-containing protein, partial [Verrucomicrobiia bacterium]
TRWNWGGTLVVHEIVPQPNGTLGCRMPDSVREAFAGGAPVRWTPVLGEWLREHDVLATEAAGRFSAGLLGEMPDPCLIEATVRIGARHGTAGLILRVGEGMERSYQLRLEPGNGRMVFDRWPRHGDQPHMIERPLGFRAGEDVHLRVLVDGSCMVAYANDRVALSCRMYEGRTGEWGVFAADGPASFADLACRRRATQGQAISPLKT